MGTLLRHQGASRARQISAPQDLRDLRQTMRREFRRQQRRGWSLPRTLAVALLVLMLVPVADAIAGARQESRGCLLVSVVDGDTLTLDCPGRPVLEHEVMGLDSPPILGARCVTEAWWGLRSRAALRTRLWQASELSFVIEPRARLAMVMADGVPLHRLIAPVPPGLCL